MILVPPFVFTIFRTIYAPFFGWVRSFENLSMLSMKNPADTIHILVIHVLIVHGE